MKQLVAYAQWSNPDGKIVEEDFEVSSRENAVAEIIEAIEEFNRRSRGQQKRKFIKISRFENKDVDAPIYDWDMEDDFQFLEDFDDDDDF